MVAKLILCIALILSVAGVPAARANIGDTFNQIAALYGPPVTKFAALDGDTSKSTYVYQFNDRRIYVNFMRGKSVGETVRTAPGQMSDKLALAIATKISGVTNWTEMSRTPNNVDWLGSMASANLQHHPDADVVLVLSMQLVAHEIQRDINPAPTNPSTTYQPETKAAQAEHVLKWQQKMADQGDAYGELQMGLRYRDGNGVPQDLGKARDWLQKAADQGDTDASNDLVNLSQPKSATTTTTNSASFHPALQITSAKFGMGNNNADVTATVSQLLHDQPDGFTVNAQTMGADPLPGKRKRLLVKYTYQGTNYVFPLLAGKRLAESDLIRNTIK